MTDPTSALRPGRGRVAVVTIAHGRHAHLRAQHLSLAVGARRPDDYVVVAMDDAAIVPTEVGGLASRVVRVPTTTGGLPLAAARNRGVEAALAAGAATVVLLDVDCLAAPDLVGGYAEVVAREPRAVWTGPVTYLEPPPAVGYPVGSPGWPAWLDDVDAPHPARPAPGAGTEVRDVDPDLFWSLSCAVSVGAWRRLGGFCERYTGYGAEDTDLGAVAAHRGVEVAMTGAARAYHQHHPVSRPPVEHLDAIVRNARTFRDRWGRWPMSGWLAAFADRGLVAWDPDGDRLELLPGAVAAGSMAGMAEVRAGRRP